MAKIDDLLNHIADPVLRRNVTTAVSELREPKRFGLVFEHHVPETVVLPQMPMRRGMTVVRRDGANSVEFQVVGVKSDLVLVKDPHTGQAKAERQSDFVVVRPFGEPVYPTLSPLRCIARNEERPWNTVINGENYHALQLLLYLHRGQVDCCYLDPPYNTGAKDWTYNNHFVDKNDRYRHSKWLSMMEKRLRLAKELLRPDGVLIVTIDENEVHHLGMLLEELFSDARRQMVTICINPSGVSGGGLSRVEEYAFFCFLGNRDPEASQDDMLTEGSEKAAAAGKGRIGWESLLRRGNAWYRRSRKNLCYPVILSKDGKRIVGAGEPFTGNDEKRRAKSINGKPVAWPVRKDGKLGIWRVDADKLLKLTERGFAYVSSRDEERGTWTIQYLMAGTVHKIDKGEIEVVGTGERAQALLEHKGKVRTVAKTMWHRGRHTAGGAGGTQLLAALLGERALFPFPKSVYAVRDCLQIAVGDRKHALVVDVFAGSGTTLNATWLLNSEDGGSRRCVMVTNNEVDAEKASELQKRGLSRGDREYEAHGIFERVTRPRCEAALTGVPRRRLRCRRRLPRRPPNLGRIRRER